jgi:hypothetical protein
MQILRDFSDVVALHEYPPPDKSAGCAPSEAVCDGYENRQARPAWVARQKIGRVVKME